MSTEGPTGPGGPGFVGAYVDSNHNLIIYRTDHTSFVAGRVVPAESKTIDAIQLDPRTRDVMVSYANGECEHIGHMHEHTGPTGTTGATGTGIVHSYVDECGYLNIMYSNHHVTVAGYVQGPTGPTGPNPSDATVIESIQNRLDRLEQVAYATHHKSTNLAMQLNVLES
jgi:hypothetical protein